MMLRWLVNDVAENPHVEDNTRSTPMHLEKYWSDCKEQGTLIPKETLCSVLPNGRDNHSIDQLPECSLQTLEITEVNLSYRQRYGDDDDEDDDGSESDFDLTILL